MEVGVAHFNFIELCFISHASRVPQRIRIRGLAQSLFEVFSLRLRSSPVRVLMPDARPRAILEMPRGFPPYRAALRRRGLMPVCFRARN